VFLSVTALDLAQNSNVQDAFVIAVEQQARERLERLSALKRIKPVDMTKLSQQVSNDLTRNKKLRNEVTKYTHVVRIWCSVTSDLSGVSDFT
jgi:hypothetical protein